MTHLLQDLRYALRAFRKSPGFTLAAILSLGLGIGANTAIFSVTNALLFRPLPYPDPERLVILWNRSPGLNIAEDWFSTAQYFDIKNGHGAFERLAIAIGANYNLVGEGEPERVGVIRVSSNLLPMLGARAAAGRLFTADEDAPGRSGTAVLGHGLWARRFGRDPAVVGKTLTLNGQGYEVVGVLPQEFSLPREVLPTLGVAEEGEVFLPLPLGPDAATNRDHEDYNIVGKLKPGVAVAGAQAEMDAITARLRREHPDLYPPTGGLTFSIVPLLEQVVGNVRRPLRVLVGAVAFVLLIACANVANLLLSRAVGRRQEMAVRMALGAGRLRIVRQLLTESVLLSLGGGALGVLLAAAAVAAVRAAQPADVPRLGAIAVDGTVLAFTLLLATASGLLFGLAPAWGAARVDPQGTLKDASRGSAGAGALWGRGNHVRSLLVVSELALAVVLLVGAGLLLRSFARLQDVDPGFDARGVLTVELAMNGRRYEDSKKVLAAYRELWERLERLPGVSAAGGVTSLPLSGYFAWGPITIEGHVPPSGEDFVNADIRVVGGRYFEALGIPLRSGRAFTEADTEEKDGVVIVDEHLAQEYWPNGDAVGRRIRMGGLKTESPWRTIVGVVGRVKQYGLDSDGRIALYFPQTQWPSRSLYVAVKTAADPASLAAAVGREVRSVDPDLPPYHVRTMARRVTDSLARQRFLMTLLGAFAAIAATLAAIGVYGVMSYLVAQGRRELGIRIALGATPATIAKLVVGHGMAVAVAGLAAGLAGAVAASRLLASLLFGVPARDPLTFGAVAAGAAAVAFLATWLPAQRAARIDPTVSLRDE
jgi:predicted permease